MKTVCVTLLAVLLLALLLSSQVVLAQNNTITTTTGSNFNSSSPVSVNSTENAAAERTGALALLLPMALGVTLLHGWSQ